MATDPLAGLFQPVLEATWTELQFISAEQLGLPTTDWGTYSPERNIIIANARMLEALGVASIERWRGMFLGYAQGESLTILATETYQSPRLPATFAACVGDFFNSTLVTYTVSAGEYVTVRPSTRDDITYQIDGPLSIPPGLTADVPVRAVLAGSLGSAQVGEINQIENDVFFNVAFVNTSVAVGLDEETDDALAIRARLGVTALSISGPSGAYEYFAKGGERNGQIDSTIAAIGVNRVSVVEDLATGTVTVYYATISGGVSGTATTGDLGAINAKILLRVRPNGVDYTGLSATPLVLELDYNAYVSEDAGIDAQELMDAIEARWIEYVQSLDIGGPPQVPATPGYKGAVMNIKVRGLINDIQFNGNEDVVNYSQATVNGTQNDTLILINQVPVPGAVTGQIIFQPPQVP